MTKRLAKDFRSFADLAAAYERDRDYRIVQVPRAGATTAIVAPHGGGIEAHTSDIAREIAGGEFTSTRSRASSRAATSLHCICPATSLTNPAVSSCSQVATGW
jgi:phage replication-related protein YjqB (UPF0714/DUF867 family)